MTDSINIQPMQRKAYVKPEVEVVDLMPKQTVLGGCLTSSNIASGYEGSTDPGCGTLVDPKCSF